MINMCYHNVRLDVLWFLRFIITSFRLPVCSLQRVDKNESAIITVVYNYIQMTSDKNDD